MAAVAARWYTVRMRRSTRVLCLLLFVGGFLAAPPPTGCAGAKTFSISRSDYLEKVHGWWMGKLIGVTLGGPFEFRMPWPPKEVTGYVFDAPVADYFGDNDDLYVGMAYLLALDRHGAGVTQVQMAAEFFRRLEPRRLWMANQRAYMNLAAGLAPPKTGHPVFNECSWAIDAQIENDVWGVVCPGMIDTACRYADLAAHVTNHADGAYGGLFTAALASGAFAERDVETLVETALAKLPPSCDYAEAVRDVIAWHREEPGDWKKTRERIRSKWQVERGHRDESAVVNGAAVVTALLYGGGDFDTTVRIGTMAGWDTDCNAASAGGDPRDHPRCQRDPATMEHLPRPLQEYLASKPPDVDDDHGARRVDRRARGEDDCRARRAARRRPPRDPAEEAGHPVCGGDVRARRSAPG